MSAVLVAMAVTLICSLIMDVASSRTGALVGALVLGLTPSVWGQATSAEVYALHIFFIALLDFAHGFGSPVQAAHLVRH